MGSLESIHQVVFALYFVIIILANIIQFLIYYQSLYWTVTLISWDFQVGFHTACASFMCQDVIRGLEMSVGTARIFVRRHYECVIFGILKASPWNHVPRESVNIL